MKTIFTKQYGLDNRGCYDQQKASSLSFMQNESFTINDLINSEIPLKDKYWFVIKKCDLSVLQKREIAIGVAEIVLPLYESKYPSDNRVKECIEAAKSFIGGHISLDELLNKRRAASAAASAAYADTAAASAASAASAAYAASYADTAAASAASAASAAYAATAAAYADTAAASAADTAKQKLFQYLLDFVNVNTNEHNTTTPSQDSRTAI